MQLLWLVCWTPLILPVHFQLLFQQPEFFFNYLYFKPAGVRWTRDESLYCEKKQVCSEHLKAAMSWQPSVWCLHQWELAMRPNCSSMRELSVFFCLCRFHCHLCAHHPKTTSWFRNITQSGYTNTQKYPIHQNLTFYQHAGSIFSAPSTQVPD